MLDILYQILPIFLIVFLGCFFGGIHKSFNETMVAELNKFAYFVGFPCIIISSFLSIDTISTIDIQTTFINIGVLIGFMGLILLIGSRLLSPKDILNTYFICTFFGNIAYLGFPLVSSLDDGYITSISLHIAGYLIVLFTLGIAKLEISKNDGHLDLKKLLATIAFNPLLISCFIGVIIVALNLSFPETITKSIKMVSASASPIVLFALGIFIIRNQIIPSSLMHAVAISFIKLLVLPLVFWVLSGYVFTGYDLTVSNIMAAMPVAITPFVLADIYDMDKKIVANAIMISTILGIITIPLVISLL